MDRRRILVSYGDILGFAQWIKRPSNAPEDVELLMSEIYAEFNAYAMSSGGVAKYMGDGIVVIKELTTGHNCCLVLDFMRKSYFFTENINTIIQKYWPRPHGFRMRLVAGYVYKKMVNCNNCLAITSAGLAAHKAEYIGYPINLAQRLLYVAQQKRCICHESVKQIIGKKRMGIKFRRVRFPKDNPRGIDREDLRNLWEFKSDPNANQPMGVIKNGNGNKSTNRKAQKVYGDANRRRVHRTAIKKGRVRSLGISGREHLPRDGKNN